MSTPLRFRDDYDPPEPDTDRFREWLDQASEDEKADYFKDHRHA